MYVIWLGKLHEKSLGQILGLYVMASIRQFGIGHFALDMQSPHQTLMGAGGADSQDLRSCTIIAKVWCSRTGTIPWGFLAYIGHGVNPVFATIVRGTDCRRGGYMYLLSESECGRGRTQLELFYNIA